MKNRKFILLVGLMGFSIMLITCITSCKRNALVYSTTSTVNMLSYMKQTPDRYSLFTQIVEKAGYGSFLDAYGAYTLFLPTNDGVNKYLKTVNKGSVNDIDANTAKSLVSMALLKDTLATNLFTDGKLRTPTLTAQYLITGAANTNGVTTITINKQANLLQGNVRVGNGIIHIVDNMLVPAGLTLAQTVEQNPNYSIFTEALKATGFYDQLNVPTSATTDPSRQYLTLVAQTNAVFASAGIANFNALKAKYSNTGDPKNTSDGLYLYVAYRVFPQLAYLTDIVNSSSFATLAPLEVVTSELVGQDVMLNNLVFNGVLERGVTLDRTLSDVTASNGVLHSVQANYDIKIRQPSPVYFDVSDQPEIRRVPGLYKAPNKNYVGNTGPTQGFGLASTTGGILTNVVLTPSSSVNGGLYLGYISLSSPPPTYDYYFNNDYSTIGLRFRQLNNGVQTVEFTTPIIVKGRYKIWLDYKVSNGSQTCQATFDGQALANTFNPNEGLTLVETELQMETRGFKSYSESPQAGGSGGTNPYNGHVGRLLGVVNVTTTDRHKIKLFATASSGSNAQFWLDAIEFRPIDMDQLRPKLGRSGALIP